MNKNIYKVVLYIHKDVKNFTTTARKDSSRLKEVDAQMANQGYVRHLVAECIEKEEAEKIRSNINNEYIEKGYEYKTRPQLS